ncbi:hypothetical protein Q7C_651 [Methylophaga frappieri]|uniref:Uncharacterized protein n=1 Tax=Methylophaga frappieri (strain ATCC BAA-2434 / DSM 25690 / JAM7) TaxID=754477 RepID=I1YFX9_METFJ|nr:hypothetical protein [Methylophaga frappieri]AFJ01822.1 hypothetical protein Q7C_651 [Methylophaga frappieri]
MMNRHSILWYGVMGFITLTGSTTLRAESRFQNHNKAYQAGIESLKRQAQNYRHPDFTGQRGQHFRYRPNGNWRPKIRDNRPFNSISKPYHWRHGIYRNPRHPKPSYPTRSYLGINVVAPVIYSSQYQHTVRPLLISPPTSESFRSSPIIEPQSSLNPWLDLGNFQTTQALNGFNIQSQREPNNALPKIGVALTNALRGQHIEAERLLNKALLADVSELQFFRADANLALVLDDIHRHFTHPDSALMQAMLHYLRADYRAAQARLDVAQKTCTGCQAEQNLQYLLSRQNS